jgi:glycosyltransferase involved in cell wall biosynthesis
MLKVIAYTGGNNTPSRVPRVQQYVSVLRAFDIDLTECASAAGLYPPDKRWQRPLWGAWNLLEHVPAAFRSYQYDITFFHREMLSTLVTMEPFTKRPRIFDIDDAIWLHRNGGGARQLAQLCDHVICGNEFLASEFTRWNPCVSVLPTAVDTNRFAPCPAKNIEQSRPVIGWLGLSSGFDYLREVEPALREVSRRHPDAIFRIVSDRPPELKSLPQQQVEFLPYARSQEVEHLQQMTIGIMPLSNTTLCRGKCSFKMLLYMACGIPVVVSPIGMNAEVLEKGDVGFGALHTDDWIDGLDALLKDPDLRERMGACGREVVTRYYSVEILAPKLAEIILRVANRGCVQQSDASSTLFSNR